MFTGDALSRPVTSAPLSAPTRTLRLELLYILLEQTQERVLYLETFLLLFNAQDLILA
jgi:hypothetical protein